MKTRTAIAGTVAGALLLAACGSGAGPDGQSATSPTTPSSSTAVTMSGPCGVLTPDDLRELVGDGNVTKASVINDGCEWITSAGGGVSYSVEKSTSAPDQAGSRTIRTADGDLLASPASEKSGNCIATMVPTQSLERGADYLYESLSIVIMPAESSPKSSSIQGKSVCERAIPQIGKMLRGTGLAE